MTPSSPARNEFIDYAKGILIFLVTLGHVIQFVIYRDAGFYQNPLFKAIYMFHMPLFMALAGYVAFGSLNRTLPGKFVLRRVVNLVLPIFSWSVLAYAVLFAVHPVKNLPGATRGFLDLFFGSLWFLWALFESSAVVALARRMRCDNIWFAAASSVLCCLFVPDFGKLYLFKFMFPFFWAGYLAAQNPGWWRKLAGSKWVLGVAVAGAIASCFFWDENTYVYVSRMTFNRGNAGVILFRFAAGVLASGAALWIFHLAFLHWRRHQPVIWMGTRSLYIFVLQSYFFSAIGQFAHKAASPPHFGCVLSLTAAPVLGLIFAVIFGLASRWIEKFPVLALVFFGKQLRKAA